MRCVNCLKFFDDFYGFCPYCGHEKIDYDLYPSDEDNKFKSELFNQIGKRLVKEFKKDDAFNAFNESIKFNNENICAWKNKADLHNDDYGENYTKAMDCIEKALEINPNDLEAIVLKGKILKNTDKEKSKDYFEDILIKCNGSNEESLIAKGDVLYELNDYDSAITAYTKALDINPLNSKTWEKKGKVLCYNDNKEDGIKSLRKSLLLNPYDIKLWRDLRLYCGDLESEIHECDNALLIFPKSEYEWRCKADNLKSIGDYENAIKCYDMDMEVEYHSTMDNSYISQADCFIELEDYENAIKSLDKALNIWPENFTTIKSKGDCYFNLKQYQKALECYEVLIKNKKNWYDVEISKGEALLKIDKNHGIAYFDELLKKELSLFDKAKIYFALEDYDQSLMYINQTIDKNDSHSYNHLYSLKAQILYKMGDKQDSLEYFDKSIEDYPTEFAIIHKSLILEEQKEYKKAIDCLDEILESKPYDKKIISKKEELQGKLRDM